MSNKKNFLSALFIVLTLGVFVYVTHLYNRAAQERANAELYAQINENVKKVLPEFDNNPASESYEVNFNDEVLSFYPAKMDGKLIGTAIQASDTNGYNGLVKVLVGINADGILHDIMILEHYETEGFGSLMTEPEFKDQFKNFDASKLTIALKEEDGNIDAIVGATISSSACCNAVRKAFKAFESQK